MMHNMMIGMENLNDTMKQLKDEMRGWEEPQEQEILDDLNKEVPAAIPISVEQFQPPAQPSSVTIPILPSSDPILFSPVQVSSTDEPRLSEMQRRLTDVRFGHCQPMVELEGHRVPYPGEPSSTPSGVINENKAANINTSQPRRIIPNPVSFPFPIYSDEEKRVGTEQVARRFLGSDVRIARADEDTVGNESTTHQHSGVSRPTIGETTISPTQEEAIRDEVRSTLRKIFPGIGQTIGQPGMSAVDLTGEPQHSVPVAIAGSEVLVASTRPNNGAGENPNSFSRLMASTRAANPAQTFAHVQWRPKEPPCYFGRSNEDVHTWTSLVRHYLTFMGGSDAQ